MPGIHLDVSKNFIDEINYKIRVINNRHPNATVLSANEIANEALGLYKWALDQVYEGYAIVSTNKEHQLILQVELPNLPAKVPTK